MKTRLFLMSTVAVLGTSLLTPSYAANTAEYLHFTRHRDSNGNLLMAPTQHQAEPAVMQKTVMPSQPKTFERRSTDWGMSVQEVKENEPVQSSWELQSPLLADYEQRVAYHTQIEGIEAALTYTFYEDHLGQAKYVFEPQHEDAVEFVNDFHTVEGWISQSYGSPISVQEIWLDTLYQYDKSLWGQAVRRGHLVMVAEWKKPGTDIVLVLDGGNDEVGLVADFASTTFVVPVSLDTKGQEESVEEVIEETTSQETLPTEPTADSMAEEVSVQDLSLEDEGSAESRLETEVASQGPANEMQDLEEIEQMLNEEYPLDEPVEPVMEGGSAESEMMQEVGIEGMAIETVPDTHASVNTEEIGHDLMEAHPMDEQHIMDEEMNQGKGVELTESMIDSHASESAAENVMNVPVDLQEAFPTEPTADPLAEDFSGQDMTHAIKGSGEFHPETEVASQGPVSEMDEMEEIEHMLNEEYPVDERMVPAMDGDSDEEMNQGKGVEPTESMYDSHASESTLENGPAGAAEIAPDMSEAIAMDEHANDHVMEAEAELEPHHL